MSFAGLLRTAAAVALATGVVCQFVQHTDPTAPWAYFTIWSAVLAACVLTGEIIFPPGVPAGLRGAATVGTVVSGIIFATVIAPATPTGTWFQPHDDLWVRTANVLLHGVGPLLMIAIFAISRADSARPWRQATRWCAWPLLYLIAIYLGQTAAITAMPYPFLDPTRSSLALVLPATLALTAIFLIVGRGLIALNQWVRSRVDSKANPAR